MKNVILFVFLFFGAVLNDLVAQHPYIVEENAQPKGGLSEFYQYVSSNIKYPAQARRLNVEGRVYVEFIGLVL